MFILSISNFVFFFFWGGEGGKAYASLGVYLVTNFSAIMVGSYSRWALI